MLVGSIAAQRGIVDQMIYYFPDEEMRSEEARQHLAHQFEFCDRLLRFWFEHPKEKWLAKSSLPGHVIDLAMTLNVQICRHFRSVLDECRRCEAAGALIVSRSLYESMLAVLFVLKPRVRIILEPLLDKSKQVKRTQSGQIKYHAIIPTKKRRGKRADNLDRSTRAYMYLAHSVVCDIVLGRKCKNLDGLKRSGIRIEREAAKWLVHFDALISMSWMYVLTAEWQSYCGLSVSSIAKMLDSSMFRWYETIYSLQSRVVHAADALRFVTESPHGMFEAAYLSNEPELRGVIEISTGLFLIHVMMMQKFIGFGPSIDMALDGFQKEWEQIKAMP